MNEISKEQFQDLCSAYVLGVLEGDEVEFFLTILKAPTLEQRTIYTELNRLAQHLPLITALETPSLRVKQKLMSKVDPTYSSRKKSTEFQRNEPRLVEKIFHVLGVNTYFFWKTTVATILIISLGLGLYIFHLKNSLATQRLFSNIQAKQVLILQDSLQQSISMLKVLQTSQLEIVVLNGLAANSKGYGKILWDAMDKKALLYLSNLPITTQEKTYQLWVIIDNKPFAVGVFPITDGALNHIYKINHLLETDRRHISGFAVTLEPKEGSTMPTGKMILMGNAFL